jgi:glycosyltransferase involved in cell wall biosynthesis
VLKVVHAAKFYPPMRGGMETVLGDLCNGTSSDWDVHVVGANDARATVRERCGRVAVVRAAAYGEAASVSLCPTLPWHLWTHPADCIVLHEPNPIAGASLWLRTPSRRFIIWHHSDIVRPWWAHPTYGRLQRMLYRRADCVIASSPNLAIESPLVRLARRTAIIPFGIDLTRYRRSDPERFEQIAAIRARFPGPRLLFVGRLVYYKGIEILLGAARQWPGTILIAGEGVLEPLLRQTAKDLGLGDRIQFVGRVEDEQLPAYYQACDAFVLPSLARTEAFGVVQVEAMAAGLPVISTRLPTGVPWVNQHESTGLVVPPGDADALGAALRRLAEDDNLRRRFGEAGRRRADAVFSRADMVRAFRTVVEAVAGAPEELDERLLNCRFEI